MDLTLSLYLINYQFAGRAAILFVVWEIDISPLVGMEKLVAAI